VRKRIKGRGNIFKVKVSSENNRQGTQRLLFISARQRTVPLLEGRRKKGI